MSLTVPMSPSTVLGKVGCGSGRVFVREYLRRTVWGSRNKFKKCFRLFVNFKNEIASEYFIYLKTIHMFLYTSYSNSDTDPFFNFKLRNTTLMLVGVRYAKDKIYEQKLHIRKFMIQNGLYLANIEISL